MMRSIPASKVDPPAEEEVQSFLTRARGNPEIHIHYTHKHHTHAHHVRIHHTIYLYIIYVHVHHTHKHCMHALIHHMHVYV